MQALRWIASDPTLLAWRCALNLLRTVRLAAVLTLFLASICPDSLHAQQPVTVRPASLAQPPEAIPPPAAPDQQRSSSFQPPADQMHLPLRLPATEPPSGAEVLTLSDLEQIALMNNPSIGRAQAMVAAARGNWVQVGLPPNFSWGYAGQQIGSGPRPQSQAQHALMIDGELIMGGKLRLNRAVAEWEIGRAQQNLYAQQQRVLTDVHVAFYEALIAQRNLELAEQLLKIARDSQSTAQTLLRIGETARIELNQAMLETFAAENNLNDARQRHFAAWQILRSVLGTPLLPAAVLRGDLETIPDDLDFHETLGRLLAVSPEIGAAVANVNRAQAMVIRARREPIPNIRVQGGPQEDESINGKTDGMLQVLLPLPFINRNQGAIAQARAELTAAQRALEQTELSLQNRLAPVYERYASAAFRVRRYRESMLPVAEQTLDAVRRLWAGGEYPFLNYLTAQRTYFQLNQQYLQSLLDLRTASAQIEGLLLNNSLNTAP